MTTTAISIFSAIVVAILTGLVRFAFSNPGPYSRLLALVNGGFFLTGMCVVTGTLGYMFGVYSGALRYDPHPDQQVLFSPWVIVPALVIVILHAFCVVLAILPRAIGMSDDEGK